MKDEHNGGSGRGPLSDALRHEALTALRDGRVLHDGEWLPAEEARRIRRRGRLHVFVDTLERLAFWAVVASVGVGLMLVSRLLI